MIKWTPFPFLRIALAFILGIQAGMQFPVSPAVAASFYMAAVCGFIALLMAARRRRSAFGFTVAGLVGLLAFALAGTALTQIRSARSNPANLVHLNGEITHYTAVVNDFLLYKPSVLQTTLAVQQVKINGRWQPAAGNIQVSFRRPEVDSTLQYGQVLFIKGQPRQVAAVRNPGQFDYRKYLANQQIYHQQFLNSGQFEIIGRQVSNPAMALSIQLRQNLDAVFKKLVPNPREYGIASALVLGIKDQLDNQIKATYTNTGTMHVLAVSGLHVGLVFLLLNFGLKRLRSTPANRLFSAALILSTVWAYAFITALSPSVLRAAVMFTFLQGAQVMVKKTNIYNTLAVAAFTLLCFNPYYLLDVGFQLSFLAVLAIVYLHPRLYRLYTPETRLGRHGWGLVCISLAAQIGTFPLSLYYFHQFPVYFLLSNLIAVPLSTAILYCGLAVLLLGWAPGLGYWLGQLMQGLLWLMNELMGALEKLPLALINRIAISGLEACLLALFILLTLAFLARPRFRIFALSAAVLLLFSGSRLRDVLTPAGTGQFIVFAAPRQSVMGFVQHPALTVLADSGFLNNPSAQNFTLESTLLAARLAETRLHPAATRNAIGIPFKTHPGGKLFSWRGLTILTLHAPLKTNHKTPLPVDVLVLQKNVFLSPEKLKANFKPEMIVFDSSNEGWYVRWLGQQLRRHRLPFHDVSTQGAYVKLPPAPGLR